MKRWLLLIMLLFTFGTASAQTNDAAAVNLWLHTRDGWLVPGEVAAICPAAPSNTNCVPPVASLPALPETVYPLPDEPLIRVSLGSTLLSQPLKLELQPLNSDLGAAETTIEAAPNSDVEWQPNVPSGDYVLSINVYPQNADIYKIMTFRVRVLTSEEADRFFPSPPPLLLSTHQGWVEGLHGTYCFPSGENMGCVDAAARPTPEDYDPLPQGNLINLRLGALPYPESVSFTLSRRENGEDVAALEYDLTDEPLDFLWTPEVAAGDYIVMVWLRWEGNADAMYIFGVRLAEPISPPQFGLWTADNLIVGGTEGSSCWPDAMGTLCRDVMFATPEVYHRLFEGNLLYVVLQSNNFPAQVYASLYTPAMESVLSSAEMRAAEPGIFTLVIEEVAAGD